MILEVTNGLKNITLTSPTHKDEAQQLLHLPKKTIHAGNDEKNPLRLTDPRLPTPAQLTFTVKGKKIYLSTNILPSEILRPYPESITVKNKES